MLSDPAEPRVAGEGPLEDGCAVDERPVAEGAHVLADAVGEPLQPPSHETVVVASEGVAGDVARRPVRERLVGGPGRVSLPVVHAHRDDAQGPGHEVGGPAAPWPVPGHVAHLAVPPGREPVDETGLVLGEVDSRDSRPAETELVGPLPDERRQGIEPAGAVRRVAVAGIGGPVLVERHGVRRGAPVAGDDTSPRAPDRRGRRRTPSCAGILSAWTLAGPCRGAGRYRRPRLLAILAG